jgi:hypothetical protein
MINEADVLTAIADHLGNATERLSAFAVTGYSFEEWLNWEAYWACRARGFACSPKPECRASGFKDSKHQADLMMTLASGERAIVECGLIHDCTQSHWRKKLEADRRKLEPPHGDGFIPLQLVFVTSQYDFLRLANWTRWLERISFWNSPAVFRREIAFKPSGTFLMQAWRV